MASGDLKQALEILEYVLQVSFGNETVPTALRYDLIKNWVICKILLMQPLPKTYAVDKDENSPRGLVSKALCAAELLFIKNKGIIEVSQCPSIQDVRASTANFAFLSKLIIFCSVMSFGDIFPLINAGPQISTHTLECGESSKHHPLISTSPLISATH